MFIISFFVLQVNKLKTELPVQQLQNQQQQQQRQQEQTHQQLQHQQQQQQQQQQLQPSPIPAVAMKKIAVVTPEPRQLAKRHKTICDISKNEKSISKDDKADENDSGFKKIEQNIFSG